MEWSEVVKKKTHKAQVNSGQPPNENRTSKPTARLPRPRAPVVLNKVAESSSYADTVKVVKATGVDVKEFGATVTSMRKTRAGDLLVELAKSRQSTATAESLRNALQGKLGPSWGTVTRLSPTTILEVLDLDATASKEEVLSSILASVPGEDSDPAVQAYNCDVVVTGLWCVRSGQQVATVRVPHSLANRITHINVGWIRCRVRIRKPDPPRCHRCHGFGHNALGCGCPDVSNACRRCGQDGHKETACPEGVAKCVACTRAGLETKAHKPGLAGCAAKRMSMADKVVPNIRND